MNSRICYDCFSKVSSSPDLDVSSGLDVNSESSQDMSSISMSPSSTSLPSTSGSSASDSSSSHVQTYYETIIKIDDSPDAASHTLFAMAACLSDEDIQQDKFDELVKTKTITKTAITPGKDYLRKELDHCVVLINKKEQRENILQKKMTKLPRSNNWGKPKLVEWLRSHSLTSTEKAW